MNKKWAQFIASLRKLPKVVIFGLSFGVLGLVALLVTHAATSTAGIEAEDGTLTSSASSVSDSTASGGSAIKFGTGTAASQASSVTQYGITWTFDKSYPVGHFVNGDWWVVGPVSITSITPNFTGTGNGWEANASSGNQQGLDNRLDGWTASRVHALPYTATAGTSIIKGISHSGSCGLNGAHYPCLDTAAVLTVLGSVPAGNGATTFRPPYFGTFKPMFTTTQLQTNILPSLSPVAGAPSLASVARRFQRVQVDHMSGDPGRYMHAAANYVHNDPYTQDDIGEYGSELGSDADDAALRLMLNDSVSAKMPALINYVQAGIDFYGMHKGGVIWPTAGGHMLGRKLPAVFASVLLNDAAMKSEISNAAYGTYGDDGDAYYSTNPKTIAALAALGYGPALFGQDAVNCDAGDYEFNQSTHSGSKDCRDPIGMIDGGEIADGYQFCCTSLPMKGASLADRLLPGGKAVWNYQPFHDYVDRWVGYGMWTLPDDWNTLGKTPTRNYASFNGTSKNDGYYGTSFQSNMWNAYHGNMQ